MIADCVWEHNGGDTLLYCATLPGAFTRGTSLEEAMGKMVQEVRNYMAWATGAMPDEVTIQISQEAACDLEVRDADSDVLFQSEREPLTMAEYQALKALVLKSAADFQALYDAVPDKDSSDGKVRLTFYGQVPRSARQMYEHTRSVNAYYFGEIGVTADNGGTILECRQRGFEALERMDGFLENPIIAGSYGESWSLRKVLRRFIWHDRIHAKAMYRMALRTFGRAIANPFHCSI